MGMQVQPLRAGAGLGLVPFNKPGAPGTKKKSRGGARARRARAAAEARSSRLQDSAAADAADSAGGAPGLFGFINNLDKAAQAQRSGGENHKSLLAHPNLFTTNVNACQCKCEHLCMCMCMKRRRGGGGGGSLIIHAFSRLDLFVMQSIKVVIESVDVRLRLWHHIRTGSQQGAMRCLQFWQST